MSPYDENWLLDVETKPVWWEQRTPIRNPFTGLMDGTQSISFYKDGVCVGGGVVIPYKRKQKEQM